MKFVIHNPHIDSWYGYNVFNCLVKKKNYRKYWYILNYLLKHNRNIWIYIDSERNSFDALRLKNRLPKLHKLITRIEFFVWCLINGLNPLRLKCITNLDKAPKDSVLLSFTYQNLDRSNGLSLLKKYPLQKAFFLSHYMLDTEIISKNSKNLNVDLFIAENNLAKNSEYFRRHFPHYNKAVYTLPFVFQPRFQKQCDFNERKNLCLATGTFEILQKKSRTMDFINFFLVDTLHPIRKEIYNNKEKLRGIIDSYIGDYNEVVAKTYAKNDPILKKLWARFYNLFFVKQSQYFKFDIVEKYNEYKMFVVPEEANDLPGIGFVEGMACGAAYIGKNDPMYSDLGLKNGIHYISYDNTLNDLIEKIQYYQQHQNELEKIAQRGCEFVVENFNGKRVAEVFWNDLQNIAQNPDCIRSSFVGFENDC